jgi:hypothetical protein
MISDAEKYTLRLKEEEKQNKIKSAKRNAEKKLLKKQKQLQAPVHEQEHSTGIIVWKKIKQNTGSSIWVGFVGKQKVFKITSGIYKYTLLVFPEVEFSEDNKKYHNLKTDFEIIKLEHKAEKIAKKLLNKK